MLKIFNTPYFRKKYNFEDRSAFIFCWLSILFPLLFFIVFFVYVNFSGIVIAFSVDGQFGFDHFLEVFNEFGPNYTHGWNLWEVEWRSFSLYLLGWLMFFPGQLSNYVLFKKLWGHYVFRVIFMIPGVLGSLVTVLIYKYMVGVGGPLYLLAEQMLGGLPDKAHYGGLIGASETAWYTLIALQYVPGIVGYSMVQTGALARVPNELYEVARLDGLGFMGEFWHLAFPLTWSTTQIGIITGIAGALMRDCGVFLYTKGNYDTATMGFYFFWQTYLISGQGDAALAAKEAAYGYPSALGLLFTAILIPLSLLTRKLCGSIIEDVSY